MATVLACRNETPEPDAVFLNPEFYRMLVGPNKYMVLFNTRFSGIENASWVCSVNPHPTIDDGDAVHSTASDFEFLNLLQSSGLATNVINGLEASTRYYCRSYQQITSGNPYGQEFIFDTGPVLDRRVTYWESGRISDTEGSESALFYDTLGRVALSLSSSYGPTDHKFGSSTEKYARLYHYEGEEVITESGRMASGTGWIISYPQDYESASRYIYENNTLLSYESLTSSHIDRYITNGNRVISIKETWWQKDSIVTDYFWDKGYSLTTRYQEENDRYLWHSTTRTDYDMSKKDPLHDLQNMEHGYGNFPLKTKNMTDYANGHSSSNTYHYEFDGPWPISRTNDDTYYFYTQFN